MLRAPPSPCDALAHGPGAARRRGKGGPASRGCIAFPQRRGPGGARASPPAPRGDGAARSRGLRSPPGAGERSGRVSHAVGETMRGKNCAAPCPVVLPVLLRWAVEAWPFPMKAAAQEVGRLLPGELPPGRPAPGQ